MKQDIPLVPRTRYGEPCPVPQVTLDVHTEQFGFLPFDFIVDTASDFSTIPAAHADEYTIPFLRIERPVPVNTGGTEAYGHPGKIRIRLGGRESRWTCFFTEAPEQQLVENVQGPPGQRRLKRPPRDYARWEQKQLRRMRKPTLVLGRAGFLAEYAIAIDSTHLTITGRESTPLERSAIRQTSLPSGILSALVSARRFLFGK